MPHRRLRPPSVLMPAVSSKPVSCKYCKREKGSITKAGLELLWRRAAGVICSSCPLVQRAHPEYLEKAENSPEKLVGLLDNEPFHNDYMASVNSWEENKKSGKYNKVQPPVKVDAWATDELEMRAFWGYFWPLSLYKKHHW